MGTAVDEDQRQIRLAFLRELQAMLEANEDGLIVPLNVDATGRSAIVSLSFSLSGPALQRVGEVMDRYGFQGEADPEPGDMQPGDKVTSKHPGGLMAVSVKSIVTGGSMTASFRVTSPDQEVDMTVRSSVPAGDHSQDGYVIAVGQEPLPPGRYQLEFLGLTP